VGVDISKVNKEHVRAWVAALRSGQYKKGAGSLVELRDEEYGTVIDKYCCLGVACNISGVGKWNRDAYVVEGTVGLSGYMPTDVVEWLGVDGQVLSAADEDADVLVFKTPELAREYHQVGIMRILNDYDYDLKRLSYVNDEGDTTFDQIADMIEYTYLPEDYYARK
jgi:hypothetical protein